MAAAYILQGALDALARQSEKNTLSVYPLPR